MSYIKQLAGFIGLKKTYYAIRDSLLKWRGFHLLTQQQTIDFLSSCQISTLPANRVLLPAITNCSNKGKNIFTVKEVVTDQLHVWEYKDAREQAWLSRYGSVIIKKKVLCTDRTHNSLYRDIWKKDLRPVKRVAAQIAPFSHFQSPTGFGGYFDFVFIVLVKFCRIKDAFPGEDFSDIAISYPPFNGSYEKEYLKLLGFNPDNIIDSSLYKVISPRVFIADSRGWYPDLADILSLKKYIQKKIQPAKTAPKRIYISRSGRRRILNEKNLIELLRKFDFSIIEDKERSIEEQIDIYHNASFILGPHGASFGNIIWCQEGTHLFELFSSNYMPDFFVYLATVMNMKYSAYYDGEPDPGVNYLDGISENISVSIPKLEQCLQRIFKPGSDES